MGNYGTLTDLDVCLNEIFYDSVGLCSFAKIDSLDNCQNWLSVKQEKSQRYCSRFSEEGRSVYQV